MGLSSVTSPSKRFIEAARAAEADETDEGAERAFKRAVTKPTLKPKSKP
jgi:hypothetical protein